MGTSAAERETACGTFAAVATGHSPTDTVRPIRRAGTARADALPGTAALKRGLTPFEQAVEDLTMAPARCLLYSNDGLAYVTPLCDRLSAAEQEVRECRSPSMGR